VDPLSRAVGLSTKGSELAPCKILLEAESPEILFISKGSNLIDDYTNRL
jgi:hypothetical protein